MHTMKRIMDTMISPRYFLLATLLLVDLVEANDQNHTGFLNIDCGSSNSSYVDEKTGFVYVSDKDFTGTGESKEIQNAYKVNQLLEPQFWTVRSFPQGTRNCYTLKPTLGKGTKYLVRARFFYGNYDNKGQAPTFDLYLGVNYWDTIINQVAFVLVESEILFFPTLDHFDVCLVNTGYGIPFISVLEVRPTDNETYASGPGSALQTVGRYNMNPGINREMRYKDDVYDRLWYPFIQESWIRLNATDKNISQNIFKLPSNVIGTAYSPNASIGNTKITISNINATLEYYFYFHFAELLVLQNNQSREFNIYLNGNLSYGPLVPKYLVTTTVPISVSGSTRDNERSIRIWLNKTQNSTLPPFLNALEIYYLNELSQQGTNQTDVDAILNIKSEYGMKRNWQGDPCAPKAYVWDGVNCSYLANNPPRIISLDLSNNSLSGKVPEFLAQLPFLTVLNLKENNLTGPVPAALLQRSNNGLSLSTDDSVTGNRTLTSTGYLYGEKNKVVVPLVASLIGGDVNFTERGSAPWCTGPNGAGFHRYKRCGAWGGDSPINILWGGAGLGLNAPPRRRPDYV
ncbi:Malectin-like carbohydrate-binding protein [Trema orientale]|uniref:Malectin-like carbohydrate-binding protein n=1 Tax=Trema orientale TaxID=63057 RepID=A0A2P5EFG6_TREOI|nr:Malectin-like carbohydrate-binding protein [Trema orientale]